MYWQVSQESALGPGWAREGSEEAGQADARDSGLAGDAIRYGGGPKASSMNHSRYLGYSSTSASICMQRGARASAPVLGDLAGEDGRTSTMGSERRKPWNVARSSGANAGSSGCCSRKWAVMCCLGRRQEGQHAWLARSREAGSAARARRGTHRSSRVADEPDALPGSSPAVAGEQAAGSPLADEPLDRLLDVERVGRPADALAVGLAAQPVVGDRERVVLRQERRQAGEGRVARRRRPPGAAVDEHDQAPARLGRRRQVQVELEPCVRGFGEREVEVRDKRHWS